MATISIERNIEIDENALTKFLEISYNKKPNIFSSINPEHNLDEKDMEKLKECLTHACFNDTL